MMAQAELMTPIREVDTSAEDIQVWFLDNAPHYPQALMLLPKDQPGPNSQGTWCNYPFDENLLMWVNTSHNEGLHFLKQYKIMQREEKMSRALTVVEKKNVLTLLSNNMKAVASVVPKHLTPERLMRVAFQAIVKNPALAQCSQISLVNAIIEASQLGLEISGPLGQASLIPFKQEAVLIVEYKGKIALAHNSGQIKSFAAHPVYENDVWDYEYGLNPFLKHRPYDKDDARGELIAAYAVVQYKNGGVDFEVVNRVGAMRSKAASSAKNKADSPWNQEANEWTMWVKTAVHQLSKRIPLSPELQRANDLEEMAEQRGKQDLSHVMDVEFEEMPKEIGSDKGNGEDTTPVEPETAPDDGKKVLAQLAAFIADPDSKPLYMQACEEMELNADGKHDAVQATAIMSKIDEILERG